MRITIGVAADGMPFVTSDVNKHKEEVVLTDIEKPIVEEIFSALGDIADKFHLERRTEKYLSFVGPTYGDDFCRLKAGVRSKWISLDCWGSDIGDDPRFGQVENKNQRHWKIPINSAEDAARLSDLIKKSAQGMLSNRVENLSEAPPKPTKAVERVKYTFKVAGTSFRTDAIEDMLKEDGDYYESKSYLRENYDDGDRIWQYLSEYRDDVALVDEPENKYDPNAIRVEVGGVHIGYVKKSSTSRVRNLLKKDDVRVKIDIGGGPYKELYEDEDGKIQIKRGEIEFYAKLEITAPGEPKPVVETQLPVEVQPAVETKPSAETPVAPTPATRFCRYCGGKIAASAKFCTNCGRPATAPQTYQQPVQQPNVIINNVNAVAVPHGREKNKWVAFFLCLFLGFFGVHRFYEGKIGTGILYLFTLGLVGFGWLIDCIILLTKPNPYYV